MNYHKSFQPHSIHHHNFSPRHKTWTHTIPFLSARSHTRYLTNIRPHPTHMTKTSPNISPISNLTLNQPEHLTNHSRAVNPRDRKSTRLNSSHANISYAVFC